MGSAIFHCLGWKRRLLAASFGICAAAALPPFFLLPLLIPAFSGLVLLLWNARSSRQCFWDGWWWGLGHFTAGLYWICISLFVEPDKFAWLTPFALFGLPSVIAIYIGLTCATTHACLHKKTSPYGYMLVFPVLWVITEYARAHLFTGFPWNLTGYALNATTATLQTASLWGIYGQSWFTVQLAILPALFLIPTVRHALATTFVGILALAIATGFGLWRLSSHPTEYTAFTLRIVQANIPQSLKFDRDTMLDGLRKHITLTREQGLEKVNLVLWPETAIPYLVEDKSRLLRDIGHTLPPQTLLLTGGMHAQGEGNALKAWNAAFIMNAAGSILTTYDKHHLVPFGEFIPFRWLLPIDAIAAGMGDFERGPGPATLHIQNIPPLSPLICYEAIFPQEAVAAGTSPRWLVNITNDAWFGQSSGPYQHLEMARTRAVEQGLPLIRAANTGISAVVDAYGRLLQTLPLGTQGILDTPLPAPAT